MAQQATIVAYDGAPTPWAHNLLGEGVTREGTTETAVWREQVATIPRDAQVRFTQSRKTLKKTGVMVVECKLEIPVLEQIAGGNQAGYVAPSKVAYVDTMKIVFLSSPRSTELSRRIASQLLLNIANGIATSVTPVTTGIVADAVQRGILPN
jgi:hypothetical protein